ncbi:hypothetical protein K0M31_005218 [Melipona bicolor]|uniref:Uncharacterized protein n=1 Tax=Melipona bicolor TaxID=60889 RepID=A0AA40FUP0_9HYME|nr:hypothetical protein K0M31_005218 [Melipona bicolor]
MLIIGLSCWAKNIFRVVRIRKDIQSGLNRPPCCANSSNTSKSRSCLCDLFSLGAYILERNSEKLLHEAILDKNGSNDDDDKIVARLTPRVSSLVAWSGKHSRHSRHPLSVPPTTTSGDVHSTTLLTFLIVVLPGQPLGRKISARRKQTRYRFKKKFEQ